MAAPLRQRRTWIGLIWVVAVVLVLAAAGRILLAWWAGTPEAELPLPSLGEEPAASAPAAELPGDAEEELRYRRARQAMVEHDLRGRDITDPNVLETMGRIPRQLFVPDGLKHDAYADHPLPIGNGQTISQPYIVALMTQLARPKPESRALDIGTGSGYQAAVLAEICKKVYSIEIVEPLAKAAAARLERLGYENVAVRHGDGYRGWKEHAPFEVIIVAAAPEHVPQPLVDQLAPGGRLVIPVGDWFQNLLLVEKGQDGTVHQESVIPVRFVPMTGEARQPG